MLNFKIDKDRHLSITVPLLFVLANFGLKLKCITNQSIAQDEPFSIYFSQFDVSTIISFLSKGNNPPLFEIILHFWTQLFGIGELSVRFLPCLFSSFSVYFIYRIGQKFFDVKTAVLASSLFTLSIYHVSFAHETRVYPLFLLLTCMSMYAFLSLVKEPGKKRFSALLTVANALLIYSHFFGLFVLAIQFFTTVSITSMRKTIFKRMLRSWIIVFVVYLPYLGVLTRNFLKSASEGTWISPVSNLGQLHDFLNLLVNDNKVGKLLFYFITWLLVQQFIKKLPWNSYFKHFLAAASILGLFFSISIVEGSFPLFWMISTASIWTMSSYMLFVFLLIFLGMISPKVTVAGKVVMIWFFLPTLAMFIVSVWIPMFIPRYLIYVTPAFYLLVAIGLISLEKPIGISISLLFLVIMGFTYRNDVSNDRDVKQLVDKAMAIKHEYPNTAIYICPNHFDVNFTYYYNRKYFEDIDNDNREGHLRMKLASDNVFPVRNFAEIDTLLFASMTRVVYIDAAADFASPNNGIRSFLTGKFGEPEVIEIPSSFKLVTFNVKPKESPEN
jgi:uncharacterized membrane protein